MNHDLTAQNGELSLRPLCEADVEKLRVLRNRNRESFVNSAEVTPEGQTQWYRRYLEKDGDYVFSVFFRERWIGSVSLYDVCGETAEFGRLLIDRQAAGRGGLGVEATTAACDAGFRELGLKTIRLEVYTDNVPAQITYLKAGFQVTGMTDDPSGRPMLRMTVSSENGRRPDRII